MNDGDDNDVRDVIKDIVKDELKSFNVDNNDQKDFGVSDINSIQKMANTAKSLKEAFQSPSEKQIIDKFNESVIDRVFPSLTQNSPPPKEGFMDSNFMMAVGSRLPDVLPSLFDIAISRLGKDKTEQIIDSFQNKLAGNSSKDPNLNTGNVNNAGGQSVAEFILSLNPDDPADLHKYMNFREMDDINNAKKSLIEEKNIVMSEIQNANSPSNNVVNDGLTKQNEVLESILKVMEEDKEKINSLESEIEKLKILNFENTDNIKNTEIDTIVEIVDNKNNEVETVDTEIINVETVNTENNEVDDNTNLTIVKRSVVEVDENEEGAVIGEFKSDVSCDFDT